MSTLDIAMTEAEAKQVTARIKLLVNSIAETTEKVVMLIEQAETGKAWQALGYPSWTAYVAAEFSGAVAGLARAERVPITAKLAETGMPIRAIASVVGTSIGTVHADIVESGVQDLNTSVPETGNSSPKPITGMDGKEYVRNGRPTAAGMQDISDAVPKWKPRKMTPWFVCGLDHCTHSPVCTPTKVAKMSAYEKSQMFRALLLDPEAWSGTVEWDVVNAVADHICRDASDYPCVLLEAIQLAAQLLERVMGNNTEVRFAHLAGDDLEALNHDAPRAIRLLTGLAARAEAGDRDE